MQSEIDIYRHVQQVPPAPTLVRDTGTATLTSSRGIHPSPSASQPVLIPLPGYGYGGGRDYGHELLHGRDCGHADSAVHVDGPHAGAASFASGRHTCAACCA